MHSQLANCARAPHATALCEPRLPLSANLWTTFIHPPSIEHPERNVAARLQGTDEMTPPLFPGWMSDFMEAFIVRNILGIA